MIPIGDITMTTEGMKNVVICFRNLNILKIDRYPSKEENCLFNLRGEDSTGMLDLTDILTLKIIGVDDV